MLHNSGKCCLEFHNFSINNWKSNENLAAVKAFNRHPQYDAVRIDYDYGFIELVSSDLRTNQHLSNYSDGRLDIHRICSTNNSCSSEYRSWSKSKSGPGSVDCVKLKF